MKQNDNVQKTLKLWDKEYKKGFTSYMVLVLLKERSMYGYELKTTLENMVDSISFRESGIYQILKKFRGKGFVTSDIKKSEKGPNRKYYTITTAGLKLIEVYTKNYIYPIHREMNKLFSGSLSQFISEK